MDCSGGESAADVSSTTVDVLCWGSDTHGQHGHGSRRASDGSSSDRAGANTGFPVSAADAALHIEHNKRVAGGSDKGFGASQHCRIQSFSCGSSHSAILLGENLSLLTNYVYLNSTCTHNTSDNF